MWVKDILFYNDIKYTHCAASISLANVICNVSLTGSLREEPYWVHTKRLNKLCGVKD